MDHRNFAKSPFWGSWDQQWSISDAKSYSEYFQVKNEQEIPKGFIVHQKSLYAEKRMCLLGVFQAIDAARKDGTILFSFGGVHLQRWCFQEWKRATNLAIEHKYTWRIHQDTLLKALKKVVHSGQCETC